MTELEDRLRREFAQVVEPAGTPGNVLVRNIRYRRARRRALVPATLSVVGVAVGATLLAQEGKRVGAAVVAAAPNSSATGAPTVTSTTASSQSVAPVPLPDWWTQSEVVARQHWKGTARDVFHGVPQAYEVNGQLTVVVVDITTYTVGPRRRITVYFRKTSHHQDIYNASSDGVGGVGWSIGSPQQISLIPEAPTLDHDVYTWTRLPTAAATLRWTVAGSSPVTSNVVDGFGIIIVPRPAGYHSAQGQLTLENAYGQVLDTYDESQTRLDTFGTPTCPDQTPTC